MGGASPARGPARGAAPRLRAARLLSAREAVRRARRAPRRRAGSFACRPSSPRSRSTARPGTLPRGIRRGTFAALASCSLLVTLYAVEARPYALLGLFGLAAFLLSLTGDGDSPASPRRRRRGRRGALLSLPRSLRGGRARRARALGASSAGRPRARGRCGRVSAVAAGAPRPASGGDRMDAGVGGRIARRLSVGARRRRPRARPVRRSPAAPPLSRRPRRGPPSSGRGGRRRSPRRGDPPGAPLHADGSRRRASRRGVEARRLRGENGDGRAAGLDLGPGARGRREPRGPVGRRRGRAARDRRGLRRRPRATPAPTGPR